MTKMRYQWRTQKTPRLNTKNARLVVRHDQAAQTAAIRVQQAQAQVIVIHQVTEGVETNLAVVSDQEIVETDTEQGLVLGHVNVGEHRGPMDMKEDHTLEDPKKHFIMANTLPQNYRNNIFNSL